MSELTLPSTLTESKDDIHARMIASAPSNVNTIEGDLFWSNTRPVAEEIARTKNITLVDIVKSRFPQTAMDEDLDYCGEEDGVTRKDSDYAIHKMKFTGAPGTTILIDKIVCTEATEENKSIEFKLIETVTIPGNGEITVNAQCTEAGIIGNVPLGEIKILAKSLNGIASLSNIEIVQKGVDVEDNETYRQRMLEKNKKPITSGNIYQYEEWAKEVTSVGDAKCFSLWNGRGTVKVVIVDSSMRGATAQLIQDVYNHIESVRPILSGTLTVVSAIEKAVNISCNVILAAGYTIEMVQESFNSLSKEYLKEISFKASYVSIAKIGNILLSTAGILDYSDLRINNSTGNLPLSDEEIPVLGTVTIGVVQ